MDLNFFWLNLHHHQHRIRHNDGKLRVMNYIQAKWCQVDFLFCQTTIVLHSFYSLSALRGHFKWQEKWLRKASKKWKEIKMYNGKNYEQKVSTWTYNNPLEIDVNSHWWIWWWMRYLRALMLLLFAFERWRGKCVSVNGGFAPFMWLPTNLEGDYTWEQLVGLVLNHFWSDILTFW